MSEKIKKSENTIDSSIVYANDKFLKNVTSESLSNETDKVNDVFNDFMKNEPVPIKKFVPANAAEQRQLFLAGDIRNPHHRYDALNALDFETQIESLEQKTRAIIVMQRDVKPVQESAYRDISERFITMTQFMKAARDYNHAETEDERSKARAEFMRTNIELYGKPDLGVYQSIMQKRLEKIKHLELDESGEQIRDELYKLLDGKNFEGEGPGAFEPSEETVAWAHETTTHLYGTLLEAIPEDKEEFNAEEIRQVFQRILDEEFGGAADGWSVVIRDAQSINVRTPDKEIIIPPEKTLSRNRLRLLVCHEIGIHVLRSIIGEQTDSPQLRVGTSSYYDTDEGLGVVVEDSLSGEYKEHGEMYYIIAGLAYFEHTDFRDTYEIWSRMQLLAGARGKVIDSAYLESKRTLAYGNVMRIMRGTDELPWFKDLGYYNGANKVWKFLEKHRGDAEMFQFLIASGKIDPDVDEDRLLALEARSL